MAQPILVAVDFSKPSRRAVDEAVIIAREREAPMLVVHAVTPLPRVPAYSMSLGAKYEDLAQLQAQEAAEDAYQLTTSMAEPAREQGLQVAVELGEGAPEDLVRDAADRSGAQMIVVGSHGWKGFKRFVLGSVVQSILHEATIPVLVVPSPREE